MRVSNATPIKVCALQFKSTHGVSDKKGLTSQSRNAYNSDSEAMVPALNFEHGIDE